MVSCSMLRFVCFAMLVTAVFTLQASGRGDTAADVEVPELTAIVEEEGDPSGGSEGPGR